MVSSKVSDRLAQVRDRLAAVQATAGLSHAVRIVAVTKGFGLEAVQAAEETGLRDVGENRVQEGLRKREAAGSSGLTWHLIGHLQSNKAGLAAQHFDYIHSIDSIRLADAVSRRAVQFEVRIPVLLQVNVAGEGQKFGCVPEALDELAHRVAALPGLELQGLMTMAPFTDDVSVQRMTFGALSRHRDRLADAGLSVSELSMGMSNDYESAVAEGATILRLGTVLFGDRSR